jgi:hypothetical protein
MMCKINLITKNFIGYHDSESSFTIREQTKLEKAIIEETTKRIFDRMERVESEFMKENQPILIHHPSDSSFVDCFFDE